MTRCFWAICLLIYLTNSAYAQSKKLQARNVNNPKVAYVSVESIKRFPLPVVNFVREGLARSGDQDEIIKKIVYPVVNKSPKPVAAMVVTFFPDEPHITVLVLWHGEDFRSVLIERNAQGHFNNDAYKVLLEEIGT